MNGTMADYLVPMAAEMPDIEVGHVVSPTPIPNSAPRAPARRERQARRGQ
jgi:CO/xanthine dehydrogenase Mo-binding subunit